MSFDGWISVLNANWFGTTVGIVGIVLGYALYRRALTRTILTYQWGGLRLIGNPDAELPGDVTVTYKGLPVRSLTSTDIVFWNAGKTTIGRDQVVAIDPLQIVMPEGAEVLDARLVRVTREVNQFVCATDTESGNTVHCGFDYLDPGDGARIRLLHTAPHPAPTIRGTVKGMPKGLKSRGILPPRNRDYAQFYRRLRLYALGAIVWTVSWINQVTHTIDVRKMVTTEPFIFNTLTTLGLVVLTVASYWTLRRRHPSSLQDDRPLPTPKPDPFSRG